MFKVGLHNTDTYYTATHWDMPYNIIEQASKRVIILIQLVWIPSMPLFIKAVQKFYMELLIGQNFKMRFLKTSEMADFVQCFNNDKQPIYCATLL